MDQSAYTRQQYFRFDLQLPHLYPTSTSSEEDVQCDVNTLHRQLHPQLFEKSMCQAFFRVALAVYRMLTVYLSFFFSVSVATSCEELHCGYKQKCTFKVGMHVVFES